MNRNEANPQLTECRNFWDFEWQEGTPKDSRNLILDRMAARHRRDEREPGAQDEDTTPATTAM